MGIILGSKETYLSGNPKQTVNEKSHLVKYTGKDLQLTQTRPSSFISGDRQTTSPCTLVPVLRTQPPVLLSNPEVTVCKGPQLYWIVTGESHRPKRRRQTPMSGTTIWFR